MTSLTSTLLVFRVKIKRGTMELERSAWPLGFMFNHGVKRNEEEARKEFAFGPDERPEFESIGAHRWKEIDRIMKKQQIPFLEAYKILHPKRR